MPDSNTNTNFFQQRLAPLGVTDDNNLIRITNPEAEHPVPKVYDAKIFSEDNNGNIKILFWTLDRHLITYYRTGDGKMSAHNAKLQHYHQLRLKEPKGDMKYRLPSGKWLAKEGKSRTWPWIPPLLVEMWEQKKEIETLYLTEGVFKSWLGARYSLPVIGLTSITHYADHEGQLHYDIQRLIIDCKVKNVVVLWDGDCLDISQKALARRENLTKRPVSFYMSAKKIRKLVQDIEYPKDHDRPAVYFYYIKSDVYKNQPKGLDDLLVLAKEKGEADVVVRQALQPQKPSLFFKKFDITDTTQILREHFCLHDMSAFYKRHRDIIKTQEFKFFGDLVHWDEENEKVKLISPAWAGELFWVGDEYFMEIEMPGVGDTTRKELVSRKKITLSQRFGGDFWRHLDPFDGFCNIPGHLNYKQVLEVNGKRFYNQYFPIKHVPKEGDWQHIKGFLQHIFGTDTVKHGLTGKEIPKWHLGLDYVQILYLNPIWQLPVLILYSQENKTGKSTFGLLMAKIFGDNVVPIGNNDLQSNFNSTYSSKLLAYCEETLLERKKEAEKIKAISTSPRILVNPKGQKQYMIDFFCKFIFTSNNRRMIFVNRHDTRFWIHQVPTIEKEIPNMLDIMEVEIPAFLHYLQNRDLATEHEGRMHFHDSLLHTDAFDQTVQVNEPGDATELRERIVEIFVKDKNIDRIEIPVSEIRKEFFGQNIKSGWIKELLKDHLLVDQLKNTKGLAKLQRGTYPRFTTNSMNQIVREDIAYIGRPYVFLREHFIKDECEEDYIELEAAIRDAESPGNVPAIPGEVPPEDDLPF